MNHFVVLFKSCFLHPKHPQSTQRQAIFKTKCTINQKVCEVIIDVGCSENIVFTALVKALKLVPIKHPNLYSTGWVKKGSETKVIEKCKVPFSIGKHNGDELVFVIMDMDACHILLRLPWQFDNFVIHNGRHNAYTFQWKGEKIVLLPSKTLTNPNPTQT